ncbi:MAG: hypothetical protein ABH879_06050 [archaeon]
MIELSIPQLGENSKNTKDLVFTVLSQDQPLSLIELYNRIRCQYSVGVTYQAVRKAVDNLAGQAVLLKEGKKYRISKGWVLQLKSFFDNLLVNYEKGKNIHAFTKQATSENYSVYTLSSLFDLDNFWADILYYVLRNIKDDEERVSVNYGHYAWWMLVNLGQETRLYREYRRQKVDVSFILFRDLPLNKYAAEIYRTLGHKATIAEDPSVDELLAINTIGDTIIQVKYPASIVRTVRAFFEKHTTETLNSQELAKIVHTPCEIKFILFRNRVMVQSLNERFLKHFR